MDEYAEYLKRNTGYDWERVSRLFVDFKTKHSPRQQICVLTPDNYIRAKELANMYVPKNGTDLHDPDRFVKHYANIKHRIVSSMPWVKIDVNRLPGIDNYSLIQFAKASILVSYKLSLTGDIKLRKKGSLNPATIGVESFHNISVNAKVRAGEYIPLVNENATI